MEVGEKIFVYGTLRPGHGANDYMVGRSTHIDTTRISGEMYTMGGFPGVRLNEDGRFISEGPTVTGDLYEITDENLPKMLDRYEGYPDLYGRRKVETEHGEDAWVYEINVVPAKEHLIPSGNWDQRSW